MQGLHKDKTHEMSSSNDLLIASLGRWCRDIRLPPKHEMPCRNDWTYLFSKRPAYGCAHLLNLMQPPCMNFTATLRRCVTGTRRHRAILPKRPIIFVVLKK